MTDHPGIPPQEGVMIERQWESLAQFGPSLPEKAESEDTTFGRLVTDEHLDERSGAVEAGSAGSSSTAQPKPKRQRSERAPNPNP